MLNRTLSRREWDAMGPDRPYAYTCPVFRPGDGTSLAARGGS